MKRVNRIVGLIAVLGLVSLTSCKKDEPFVKPKLSFSETSITVKEDVKTISVELVLDKPFNEDIQVDYSIKGTATNAADDPRFADFAITSDYLEVEIEDGETTATIEIEVYSDVELEDDELIEIEIEGVDNENIELTREDEVEITIQQEDGLIIYLTWPIPTSTAQADMDLIVRAGSAIGTWTGLVGWSVQESFSPPEAVFIPNVVTEPAYGVSYVYYDGTADPLSFTASLIEFKNGDVEPESSRQIFKKTYTALNKNKWTDETFNSIKVVQTFTKTSSGFSAASDIQVPESGSRYSSYELQQNSKIIRTQRPISKRLQELMGK